MKRATRTKGMIRSPGTRSQVLSNIASEFGCFTLEFNKKSEQPKEQRSWDQRRRILRQAGQGNVSEKRQRGCPKILLAFAVRGGMSSREEPNSRYMIHHEQNKLAKGIDLRLFRRREGPVDA